jgi:H+/Cl- antiporter ClcA
MEPHPSHPQDSKQLLEPELATPVEIEMGVEKEESVAQILEQSKEPNPWAVSPEKQAKLASYESVDQIVPSSNILGRSVGVGRDLDEQGLPAMEYSQCIIFLCIGIGAAIVNIITHDLTAVIWDAKFAWCQRLLDEGRYVASWLAFCGVGTLLTLASGLVVLLKKTSAGSGYPEVLAYLNGVDIPLTFRSLFVKMTSCILINSSSLPVGLEGPVINMGGVVGDKTSLGVSWLMRMFSKDLARHRPRQVDFKRAFISGGFAGGVAVTLGAPLGGLLFVWEEMATRWSPGFAAMVLGTCVMSVVCNTIIHALLEQGDWNSLLQISRTESLKFPRLGFVGVNLELLPAVVVVGIVVGVLGGAWTFGNCHLNRIRGYVGCHPGLKIVEVVILALLFLSLAYGLMFVTPCRPQGEDYRWHVRGPCPEGYYSTYGSLMFAPVNDGIQTLLTTRDPESYPAGVLILAFVVYGTFSCLTSGSFSCGGMIVPSMMNGALIGHLIGDLGQLVGITAMNPAFLALIGAGCFFSAVTRKTFSIVIIMVEISDDLRNLMPMLLGVAISKVISGLMTPSLFHSLIDQKNIPFLPQQMTVPLAHTMQAGDVMSKDVCVLPLCSRVGDLVKLLNSNKHHAFPVMMARKTRQDQIFERRHPVMGGLHRSWSNFVSARVKSSQLTFYHPEHEAALRKKEQLENMFSEPQHTDDEPTKPSNIPTEVYGGLILRSQLLVLLSHPECFRQRNPYPAPGRESEHAEETRYLPDEDVVELSLDTWMAEHRDHAVPVVSPDNLNKFLDLSSYYNSSALSVQEDYNLALLYKSFLALGLRHVAVVTERDTPVGMITRKDLLPCTVRERMHVRLGHAEKTSANMKAERKAMKKFAGRKKKTNPIPDT